MKLSLPDNILSQLSKFIASNLALHFPKERWSDLENNIILTAKDYGYQDVEKFIHHIISSPLTRERSDILASNLTINETYFWRESQSFKALEQKILPELIRLHQNQEKRIRIWSVGCSTGEEPYSIAIVLRKLIPDIDKWNITILGSDINPKILKKANTGLYSQWSFRNAPKWLKEKYFVEKEKGKFEIIPEIKSMVTFDFFNLAEDTFPSPHNNTNAMDLIFCRNVLMYFTPERTKQVVNGLFNSLVEWGYLMIGASELFYQDFPLFIPVNFSGAIVYKKNLTGASFTSRQNTEEVSPKKDLIKVKYKRVSDPEQDIERRIPIPKVMKQPIAIKLTPYSKYEEALDLYSKGYYSDVIKKLEKQVLTTDETMLLVRAYANQGKLSEAIRLCHTAIGNDKLNPKTHYMYATILQEQNQLNEAIASLKRVIYLDNNFALSYYSLGNIFLRQGNLSGAKKCYENILSIIDKCNQDEILEESEGLTVGRFKEIINATIQARDL